MSSWDYNSSNFDEGYAQYLDRTWDSTSQPGNDPSAAPAPQSAPPPAAAPAPAAPDAPPAGTTAPTGTTQDQRDAQAVINDMLGQYGLNSLTPWAWNEIVNGASATQVELDMRQTPEFQTRFPAIAEREKAGLPPLSPGEYVALENSYTQVMRAGGLPQGFWDKPEDFHALIASDVSPTELQDRVTNAYSVVANGPQSVRDAFSSYYGVSGDAALASLMLDPAKAEPQLQKMAQAATVGGEASTYGLGVGQQTAEKVAGLGVSDFRLRSALDQAAQLRALYSGTVAEGSNISGDTGLQAALGIDAGSLAEVQNRLLGRQAEFAGGGGANVTRQGLAGLGGAITNT